MRFEFWLNKVTYTHSEYVIFIAFLQQQWYSNAPQCYIIRSSTLSLLFFFAKLSRLDLWPHQRLQKWI